MLAEFKLSPGRVLYLKVFTAVEKAVSTSESSIQPKNLIQGRLRLPRVTVATQTNLLTKIKDQ